MKSHVEYEKCRLPSEYNWYQFSIQKSWEIANADSTDEKSKLQALSLANECYKYKIDLVANGTVITDPLMFIEQKKKELSKTFI
jgi:hypothetical protein